MRILLVDDDSSVLQALIAAVNSTPGHDVRVAAGAQKAHEHTLTLGGVDLLITDVVMEPTDGITLRGELQALFPKMRAAFISGYDLSDYKEQMAGAAMLSKPVNADAVRALIVATEQALSAPPQPVAVPRAAVAVPQARPVAVSPQPVAAPMPTSVPQAVAAPQPRPVAQPVAVPVQAVAVPQAKPVAQPVPVVSAVPQAAPPSPTPVPQPVATPMPQPVPVLVPVLVPVPVPVPASPQPAPVAAQPIPVVRAVPQVSTPPPLPTPQPIAVQAPVAVPQPQPVAQPVAMPVAVPKAAPRPVAPPEPVAEPAPQVEHREEEAVAQPDQLVGVQLGDYRVQEFLGNGVWGAVYIAIQLSVNRPVGLKVLDPASTKDENMHARFLADARAKAAVQHPFIVSVFEADERNGLVFYTHEYLDGPTLEELIANGESFDEKTALQVMKATGEALNYLWSHNFAHGPLDASGIRFGSDSIPRLANLATSNLETGVPASREIQTLSGIISQLVPAHAQSPGLRALLGRMAGIQNPITIWPMVLQAVKSLEPKVIPVEAAKIKAADAVALMAVEAARKTQKKAVVFQVATLSVLVLIVGLLVWYFLVSNERDLNAQVQVPAGSYPLGSDGKRMNMQAFEIDRYEVTIGEYAKFIEFCEANGRADEHKYDHPNAPRNISHVTEDVVTLIRRASQRGAVVFADPKNPSTGIPVDLNCPIVSVSWWDAYAFAKWKGRDLPTQEEWEAAARGSDGFRYPWGNDLNFGKFNSNRGYKAMERGKLKPEDGYNYWAPVDQISSDVSPFKIIGMAGNVAEWTYRLDGKRQFPVVKGSSFASDPIAMFERVEKIPAEDCHKVYPASRKPKSVLQMVDDLYYVGDTINANTRTLYIGFRTVKRK